MTIEELKNLKNVLDDEVERYGLDNDLDDATIEELHFITNSFVKHINSNYHLKEDTYSVLKEFEEALKILSTGIFGRSFTTNAMYLFRDLPTIKNLYDDSINQLKEELEKYKKQSSQSQKEVNNLKDTLKKYKEEINELSKEIDNLKRTMTSSSRSSYDSCGGGRRTYGGC